MDSTLKQYTIIGTIFTLITGTLLHFIYGWSKKHLLVGIFCPINGSTWEHLKLLFIPMIVFSLLEYCMTNKAYPRLLPARIYGMFGGLISILIISYTYSGIIGRYYLLLDILTFIISIIAAFLISHWIQLKYRLTQHACERSFIILAVLIVCFIFFTFYHPKIALFIPH